MKVKDVMKTDIIKILKNQTCKEAAGILLKNKITGAPVVDENDNLVGVFSEKDVFRALFPTYQEFYENPEILLDFERTEREIGTAGEKKIEEIMKKKFVTANPETPVLKVGAQMIATGFHRVPVVENGKLVGIVTRHEIYQAILKNYFGMEREQ